MKKIVRKIFLSLLKVFLILFSTSCCTVLIFKFINPPITGMMIYKWWNEENYSIENDWKNLEEIDSSFPLAFISSEDQKFMQHNGFDVEAIKKAIDKNKTSKKRRGASTISQQVAKNVFLFPTKSYLRKGLEVYFTSLIELIWGKRRIMEVYLNVVELGKGVYGVESASLKFFRKSANKTTRNQAALVATVLPNPIKFNLSKPTSYMYARQGWVMRQMNNLGGERLLIDWYE